MTTSKRSLVLLGLFFAFASIADVAKKLPSEVWSWEGAQSPESAVVDEASGTVFVSNLAGEPDKKDGVGWISKLTLDGKVVDPKWLEGFSAPKGLALAQGFLWLSDIQDLVQIEIATRKIVTKVTISSAKFLNDVVVAPSGEVFVSDTLTSRIYSYKDAKISVFAEGDSLESPNGLLLGSGQLIVAGWGLTKDFSTKIPGRLYSLDLATKKKRLLTSKPIGNLDGLAIDALGNYWLSDWSAGKILRVTPQGKTEVMLSDLRGSADLAYVSSKKWLVLPRMLENKVTAFDTTRLTAIP